MSKRTITKQSGFAMVELMIAVLVIIAIAGIGYWRLSSSNATTDIESAESLASIEAQISYPNANIPTTNASVKTTNSESYQALGSASPETTISSDMTISQANKTLRINMVKFAKAEPPKRIYEGAAGKYVPVPTPIAKYMKYTAGPVGSICKVGTAPDPDRNYRYYPKAWGASFVSWVYNQASGKNNFKSCSTGQLSNYAASKGALKEISSTNKPKLGDVLLVNKTGGSAILIEYSNEPAGSSNGCAYPAMIGKKYVVEADKPVYDTGFSAPCGGSTWTLISDRPLYSKPDMVKFAVHDDVHYKYYIDIAKVYQAAN